MKRGTGVPTAAPVGRPGLQDQLAVDDRRRRAVVDRLTYRYDERLADTNIAPLA